MPRLEPLKITRTTPYKPTFRTQKVVGMFDVPVVDKLTKEWDVDLSGLPKDWKIGLITGPSGSGKSTVAKEVFGEENVLTSFTWPTGQSFLEGFPEKIPLNQLVDALNHVGFSSPPTWLQPYDTLSNGQKFRADIARAILGDTNPVVIDEYTSVVDRNVAKVASAAISKFIRRSDKQFVAVTCHYDVEEWLEPDWVYDMSTGVLVVGGSGRKKGHPLNSPSARSIVTLGEYSSTITI